MFLIPSFRGMFDPKGFSLDVERAGFVQLSLA
jgi:hypothetical protein